MKDLFSKMGMFGGGGMEGMFGNGGMGGMSGTSFDPFSDFF